MSKKQTHWVRYSNCNANDYPSHLWNSNRLVISYSALYIQILFMKIGNQMFLVNTYVIFSFQVWYSKWWWEESTACCKVSTYVRQYEIYHSMVPINDFKATPLFFTLVLNNLFIWKPIIQKLEKNDSEICMRKIRCLYDAVVPNVLLSYTTIMSILLILVGIIFNFTIKVTDI